MDTYRLLSDKEDMARSLSTQAGIEGMSKSKPMGLTNLWMTQVDLAPK